MANLIYFFRRALGAMLRSFGLTTLAITTIAISLSVLTTFILVVHNLRQLTSQLGDHVGLSAYMDQDSVSEGSTIVEQLQRWPEVQKAWILTSREALAEFRAQLGPDEELLEGLPNNVVPPSIEVELRVQRWQHQEVEAIAQRLSAIEGVTEVRYGQENIEQLSSLLAMIRRVTMVLGVALGLSTLLVVYNTIRLTLYARRDEIEIMSLVGATPVFLRAPFVIEGILQGFVGGVLSTLIIFVMEDMLLQQLSDGLAYLSPLGTELVFIPPSFGLIQVGLGTALGTIGSLGAMTRFFQWR